MVNGTTVGFVEDVNAIARVTVPIVKHLQATVHNNSGEFHSERNFLESHLTNVTNAVTEFEDASSTGCRSDLHFRRKPQDLLGINEASQNRFCKQVMRDHPGRLQFMDPTRLPDFANFHFEWKLHAASMINAATMEKFAHTLHRNSLRCATESPGAALKRHYEPVWSKPERHNLSQSQFKQPAMCIEPLAKDSKMFLSQITDEDEQVARFSESVNFPPTTLLLLLMIHLKGPFLPCLKLICQKSRTIMILSLREQSTVNYTMP